MSKGNGVSKLGMELMAAAVLSAIIGLLLYGSLNFLGYSLLDRMLVEENRILEKERECVNSLQAYVTEQGLSSHDREKLDIWMERRRNLVITLYRDGKFLYSSDIRAPLVYGEEDEGREGETKPEPAGMDGGQTEKSHIPWVYRLQFVDGTADAVINFYFETDYYLAVNALNAVIAMLAFMLILFLFIHGKVRYITLLEREIQILKGGDLHYAVTVKGKDELASLAAEMDAMRLAVLERQTQEEQARNANRDLVTAMSHDLRTPLTSLLGYVDILQMNRWKEEEQYRRCLESVRAKAYQIKEMSDKMFQYFIVYGKDREELDLTEVNGTEFLGQIVEESLFDLESEGFLVERESDPVSCRLLVDIRLVRRVFDNIFSNLLKYADPSRPVQVTYRQKEDQLRIRFVNWITCGSGQKESSCIGLKTCEKIMKFHRGSFRYGRIGEKFEAELEFPVVTQTEQKGEEKQENEENRDFLK